MIKVSGYYTIESKDEFLKEWNPSLHRYDGAKMPPDFKLDETNFPICLEYIDSWSPNCCGSWKIVPLEEAKELIVKECEERIKDNLNIMEKLKSI